MRIYYILGCRYTSSIYRMYIHTYVHLIAVIVNMNMLSLVLLSPHTVDPCFTSTLITYFIHTFHYNQFLYNGY